jgi:transcriptional regulator with XRE-family HTH domain
VLVIDSRARFRAVAEFLRRCRERTTPDQVGLTAGRRQRLHGLRREQVAQLAGISETWYARLEQGRERGVSSLVLHSLADALRLETVEREYLIALASSTDPTPLPTEESLAALQRFVSCLDTMPALVLGARWDILVWNPIASLLFGGLDALPPARRNILWLVFGTPSLRTMLDDWEAQAHETLAQFRLAWARHLDEPRFTELIDDLSAHSPELARWWAEHDVRHRLSRQRSYVHPTIGKLVLEMHVFRVYDPAELWLVTFAPLPGTGTAERLSGLVEQSLAPASGG